MRLLADYPADGANAAIEAARAQNWIDALAGLPAWAIEAARMKWVRSEVEGANPDFAPKPARFREIVSGCMAAVYERRSRLTLLLRAEPEAEGNLPPEKRQQLADMLRDVSDQIKAGHDQRFPGRAPEPFVPPEEREKRAMDHAREIGAAFRANPPQLSPALRSKLESEGRLSPDQHHKAA